MTDKQRKVLTDNLTSENVQLLEDKNIYSDFINLILQIKQPNRWAKYVNNKVDAEKIDYNLLIELEIFNLFDFIDFIAS
jgi:hypothetical protein